MSVCGDISAPYLRGNGPHTFPKLTLDLMCYKRRLVQVQYLAVTLVTQWQQAHSCTPTYMEFRAEWLVCPILTDGILLTPFIDDGNKAIIRTETS